MDEDHRIRCQDCMTLLNQWGNCPDCYDPADPKCDAPDNESDVA